MKKRQCVVQQFSTFLSFSDASSLRQTWLVEIGLERTMSQQVQAHPEKTAEQWARYFLNVLRIEKSAEKLSTPCEAQRYLSAYLQEACYHAAQKVQRQFHSVRHQYSLADLFQIGNLLANQPAKLFRNFNLEYYNASLESYAKTAIFRFIGNTIYTQDLEAKREKFSDYGLLRDLSNKELKEALASRGIGAHQIELYCLARQCFEAVCQPQNRSNSRSLEAPSQADLAQITYCYHQRCTQLGFFTVVDAQKIQIMLSTCIGSAREYRSKRVVALEPDDMISDPMPTPLEMMIQSEERQQIEALISEVFTTIPEIGQTLMKLWLGLNLTQTEIATVMQHKHPELQKQYQVARQIGRSNRKFLKELIHQCSHRNPNLHEQTRCFADTARIDLIQALLDECLQAQCKRLVYSELEQLIQHSFIDQQDFIQAVETQLEKNLNLLPMSLKIVDQKIVDVVDEWKRSTIHLPSIDRLITNTPQESLRHADI